MTDREAWESLAAIIAGAPVFFGSWIYCIINYGYLMGVGLGWLPSIIVGVLAAVIAASCVRYWVGVFWLSLVSAFVYVCVNYKPHL